MLPLQPRVYIYKFYLQSKTICYLDRSYCGCHRTNSAMFQHSSTSHNYLFVARSAFPRLDWIPKASRENSKWRYCSTNFCTHAIYPDRARLRICDMVPYYFFKFCFHFYFINMISFLLSLFRVLSLNRTQKQLFNQLKACLKKVSRRRKLKNLEKKRKRIFQLWVYFCFFF